MREFVTAVKAEEEEEPEALTFMHDGREVTFYQPGSGQLAVMATISTSGTKDAESARTILTFFFSVMGDETREYFQDRLMDRKDNFELETEGGVLDIFEFLMEEWSGKASKQPSDYQQPRKQTGRTSTGNTRAKASGSSASRSRASSTSSKRGS